MSKQEQIKCGKFIEEYLQKRENMSLIVLFLDIRHKPSANDKLMYNYIISTKRHFICIASKADKIAATKVLDTVKSIQQDLNPLFDIPFIPFSTKRAAYKENVWEELENYI